MGHNLLKFIIRNNYQGMPLQNVKIMMKQVRRMMMRMIINVYLFCLL